MRVTLYIYIYIYIKLRINIVERYHCVHIAHKTNSKKEITKK